MTLGRRAIGLIGLALAAVVGVSAQTINMRLGTVAPKTSPWVEELQRMGQRWANETAKRVRFVPFGDMSSESSVIARLGTSGLELGALSVVGLAEIDDAFNVLGIPFFFESDAELLHVLKKLEPVLKQRLEAKRFHLVLWGHGGWVQVFSKHEIRTLSDLQRAKLFTSTGSPKTVQWYTENGFHVVPLSPSEIPKQLKLPTGAIDATPAVPPLALSMQFYKDAPYMLDIRVAPLVAGVVMTNTAWNRLSDDDRTRMLAIAADTETRLFADAPNLDASHIKEMQASALKVVSLDRAAAAEFRAAAGKLTATQRGGMIPADIYDLAVRERDAYRKSKPRQPGR
jgi:TRAP-type C4-dicarboxylate transport system substrate-binding protein